MRRALCYGVLAAAVALGACAPAGGLTPQAQRAFTAACKGDAGVQPIAAAVLAQLLPQSTPAVAMENAFIHPSVMKYCEGLGQTAVAVPVTVAAPAAKPTS